MAETTFTFNYQWPEIAEMLLSGDETRVGAAVSLLVDRDRQIEDAILGVEKWHEIGSAGNPSFANSWVNFGAGWDTAAFFKDSRTGLVYTKGLIKSGTTAAAAFTLPVGYRPFGGNWLFPVIGNNGAEVLYRLDIQTDGQVIPRGTTAPGYLDINAVFRTFV